MRIRRPPPAPVEMLHKDPYICWFELLGGVGWGGCVLTHETNWLSFQMSLDVTSYHKNPFHTLSN